MQPLVLQGARQPQARESTSFSPASRVNAVTPRRALGSAQLDAMVVDTSGMVEEEVLRSALAHTLAETRLAGLGERYEGKVRDNYTRGDRRFIVVTDRISAFDHVLGTIPFKGQVLNRLAAFWFERTRAVAPNHMIGVLDPNVLECVECAPLPVELVVRAYLTGTTSTSILTHYEAGARVFAGHPLPDGLTRHARLPEPILTPATKAPKGEHDQTVSREEILAGGAISPVDFDRAGAMALALFAEGQRVCASRGLVLVDTKYEVGKTRTGEIVLIDEIHTPDSSRFWVAATLEERLARGEDPETLDKDYVRRWYRARGYQGDGPPPTMHDDVRVEAARRYIEVYERITGTTFVPDTTPPLPRIEAALARAR